MSGEKVLIIDDSAELRSLLESILPYGGYKAISAGTGQDGLNLAAKMKPDVILVDLELPDTNGLKILEELNQQKSTVPAIMMTGYGSEGIAARALRLGVQGYLIKPFTADEVFAAIEKALRVGRLSREKEQLAAFLDRYARDFKMLSAISHSMILGLDPDRFLQRIVEAGLFVTHAEEGALLLWGEKPNQLQVVAAQGQGSHTIGRFYPPEGDGRLRVVLHEGAAVRLHAPPGATIQLQTGDLAGAVLQVPLKMQDQVLGLLSMTRRTKNAPFSKHDEQMLTILAGYAVMALEKNQRV